MLPLRNRRAGVTDKAADKPLFGQADDTFNLSVPVATTSLQQGTTFETTIGIDRAKNFGEDVSLKFADLPQGVTVTPESPVIKRGDENVKISFTADTAAKIGNYKVKVSGHPENGKDAEVEFNLSIAAIDSFTLNTPLLSTSLKQNESKVVSIGISRDKTFDKNVSLAFGELPPGVTIDPASPTIKHGETEATVTMNATSDAALGEFTIKVTGHPDSGLGASRDLRLSVVAK